MSCGATSRFAANAIGSAPAVDELITELHQVLQGGKRPVGPFVIAQP
jgi:hypothetical protein